MNRSFTACSCTVKNIRLEKQDVESGVPAKIVYREEVREKKCG